jgi:hypothetical protein
MPANPRAVLIRNSCINKKTLSHHEAQKDTKGFDLILLIFVLFVTFVVSVFASPGLRANYRGEKFVSIILTKKFRYDS